MAATSSVNLQPVIEKRVSDIVTETLIQEAVSLGVIRQYPVASGMDRLDIPLFSTMSVLDVVEGADLVPETITVATAKLDLNRQKAIAWAISKRAEVQSKIAAVTQAVKNGSRELAAEIDDHVFGLMVAGTGDTKGMAADFAGDALAALADSKKQMDTANVPKNGRFIIASPGFISNLLGNNNVINVDKYGSENPIQSGFVTRIYGFTIVESSSSSVPLDGYICEQMDSTAFGRQMDIMLLREEKALGVRDDYSMSHLYGSILTDTGSKRIVIVTA
jgi:hypothetical protein